MSDKFINQVYWDSGAEAYYTGSQISSSARQRIHFVNRLMEASASIIEWESATSYQAAKTVPALPILQVNHQYRLVVGLKTDPAQTVLIRLDFFNLQGDRIKRLEFYNPNHQFVYPVGAYSYKISLINAGVTELDFSRLQIADAQTPAAAFADLWPQGLHRSAAMPHDRFCFLVRDGKQSRSRDTGLAAQFGQFSYQVVNVAWQFTGDLVAELGTHFAELNGEKLHLVSTTPATDQTVAQFCALHPKVDGMVTDQCSDPDLAHYEWTGNTSWYSPELVEPDWLTISRAVKQQWKEG